MNNHTCLYPTERNKRCINDLPKNIVQVGAIHKWNKNITGKGVIVSVIDTGVDDTHPNLSGQVIGGFNFTKDYQSDPAIYMDNNGHGTHVAGVISGKFHQDNGLIGVAPDSKILALKALNSKGIGSVETLIEAIYYSMNWRGPRQEKVNIINLSIGIKNNDPKLYSAILDTVKANIPVVTASGNYGDGNNFSYEFLYPGSYSEVIEVGAVNESAKIAPFTNTNEAIDIYAPGVAITSTYLNGQTISMSGTSMAAPHVSGAIALLIEQEIQLKHNHEKLFSTLCNSTKSITIDNKKIAGCGALYLGDKNL